MDMLYMPSLDSVGAGAPGTEMEITPEMAVKKLACYLYEKMERLDPGGGSEWGDLPESNQVVYIECIYAMMVHSDLLMLGLSLSNHDRVIRGSITTK